ncbi:hypothetical protein EVC45_27505 [Paraburkholderia sp. UYCP14C]|uniref:hypothetical protein n=1 Tax=Paraburkholderia sp. UYCP14C TaxID=2511130 RepID=UPI0010215104|nr:hypothetical protein [Paraburkholderia sp. UYCP14C]RZF26481.1 hypothetical protein EVC45_27505 [Paraburkholderia sp. UYCP14C]
MFIVPFDSRIFPALHLIIGIVMVVVFAAGLSPNERHFAKAGRIKGAGLYWHSSTSGGFSFIPCFASVDDPGARGIARSSSYRGRESVACGDLLHGLRAGSPMLRIAAVTQLLALCLLFGLSGTDYSTRTIQVASWQEPAGTPDAEAAGHRAVRRPPSGCA